MGKKIAVLDTGYDSFAYEEKLVRDAGYQFEIFPGERHDREGKKEFSKDAVGLFIRWTDIDDDFLQAAPHLQAIVRYGVGYDNVDLQAASRFNVKVSNVQGYANHSVSDHAIAMMYACARSLPLGQQLLRKKYGSPPIKNVFEFNDKTLGIIGLGRIGGTLSQKATHLFNRVLAVDPYIPDERFDLMGAIKTNLDELLEQSDVLSIHCNLTKETTGLIDAEKIKLMQRKPILINTSRGPVINEDDLLDGLKSEKFHSLGIDVYCDEPPLANLDTLLNHPQVISTGHYAWYSTQAIVELQKRAGENLLMMLQGEVPKDCLNP
jgi:D-3-phosphoglycerate dehydrogenase